MTWKKNYHKKLFNIQQSGQSFFKDSLISIVNKECWCNKLKTKQNVDSCLNNDDNAHNGSDQPRPTPDSDVTDQAVGVDRNVSRH